jgi:predicted nuclease of restriction endonuclease-like (RecB) superfamily
LNLTETNSISTKTFVQVVDLIKQSRQKAFVFVNQQLIDLNWNIGEYISKKTESDGWGKGTVEELSSFIKSELSGVRGFSSENLWRMKKFYETYQPFPKLSPLLRELTWSNNLHILTKTKSIEEKEFYINLTIKEKYTARELERQLDSAVYERYILSRKKLSTVLTEIEGPHKERLSEIFKDTYVFEFLDLPQKYDEKDLRKTLVQNLKNFILELGKEFTFVGEEYRLQVGNKDFYIDLLLFHRGLQCLVAVELKIDDFKPDYLGRMNFYLEVLDQNIKLENENPAVGLLLCKTKDDEVVNYAMSRNLSPTKIAEYETKLIDKNLLKKKLHELGEYFSFTDNENSRN